VVEHLSKNRLPSALSELLVRALIASINEDELISHIRKNVKIHGDIAYIINPPGSVARAATYARSTTKKAVGIAGHIKGDIVIMSIRTSAARIDLNKVLRIISKKLDIDGGGHKQAAGARVPVKKFDEFLRLFNNAIKGS